MYKFVNCLILAAVSLGCYADTSDRDLPHEHIKSKDGMHPDVCITHCANKVRSITYTVFTSYLECSSLVQLLCAFEVYACR